MRKTLLKTAVPANAVMVLAVLLLLLTDSLNALKLSLYDFHMRMTMDHRYHHDIVVVGIDDQSLKEMGSWPWDRTAYIPLLQKLENAGAKVIVFDILFSEKGDPDSDRSLAEELAKHRNIVLPGQAVFEGSYNDVANGSLAKQYRNQAPAAKRMNLPLDLFGKASQPAHLNAAVDEDGVIRRTFLQIRTPSGLFPSLALKAAEMAGVDPRSVTKRFPYSMPIRYDLLSEDIQYIPFSQVQTGSYNLKDRIVLVGFTASGFENDDGMTPVEGRTKLVYAQANIINQLMQGRLLKEADARLSLPLLFLFLAAGWWLTRRSRPAAGAGFLLLLALLALAAQYAAFSAGYFVDAVYPLAAMLLAYLVNLSVRVYQESRHKQHIVQQFGRYLSPEVVKEIAGSDQAIGVGGVNKVLTILFLDVRGFTALSEKLRPEEVVGFLNRMFDLITEKAHAHHGTIDKFIGDAAMILYNAPLDVPYHEYHAVRTAYDIQQGMEKVRAEVKELYGVTISVGIGIHTGEVVVGNIGSSKRVDYTAIGDNVNLAARIESQAAANQILVSEATRLRTLDYFEYLSVGERTLKGKTSAFPLYEVTGALGTPEPPGGLKERRRLR